VVKAAETRGAMLRAPANQVTTRRSSISRSMTQGKGRKRQGNVWLRNYSPAVHSPAVWNLFSSQCHQSAGFTNVSFM
jgi:hypothetical protein